MIIISNKADVLIFSRLTIGLKTEKSQKVVKNIRHKLMPSITSFCLTNIIKPKMTQRKAASPDIHHCITAVTLINMTPGSLLHSVTVLKIFSEHVSTTSEEKSKGSLDLMRTAFTVFADKVINLHRVFRELCKLHYMTLYCT